MVIQQGFIANRLSSKEWTDVKPGHLVASFVTNKGNELVQSRAIIPDRVDG